MENHLVRRVSEMGMWFCQCQIKYPKCGTSINVQDILAHQLEDEIKQKYQAQIAEHKKHE